VLALSEIRVGMVVRVRTFSSMLTEFGANPLSGNPAVSAGWCGEMNQVIGQKVRIAEIFPGVTPGVKITPLTTLPELLGCFRQYHWTLEMLELVAQPVPEHPEVSALLQLLGPPPANAVTTHPR